MKDNEQMTVKEGLEKDYEDYVAKNQDGYGNAVITATAQVAKLLDKGESCERALWDGIKDTGITGFMAGCLAQAVAYYHPRGEEFRKWWNKDNQIQDEGDKANESGGVLNPAILNIKT